MGYGTEQKKKQVRFSPEFLTKKILKMTKFKEGDSVKWNWGNGTGEGKVQSSFEKSITRKIKGSEVTRNGTKDDPAYYIKQEDGDAVLKLESELERA